MKKNKEIKELKKRVKDLENELFELQYEHANTVMQVHIFRSLNEFLSNRIQSREQ